MEIGLNIPDMTTRPLQLIMDYMKINKHTYAYKHLCTLVERMVIVIIAILNLMKVYLQV